MFENVDGRRTDGRRTDAGVTGILIAHLGAFGSGELTKALTGLCICTGLSAAVLFALNNIRVTRD